MTPSSRRKRSRPEELSGIGDTVTIEDFLWGTEPSLFYLLVILGSSSSNFSSPFFGDSMMTHFSVEFLPLFSFLRLPQAKKKSMTNLRKCANFCREMDRCFMYIKKDSWRKKIFIYINGTRKNKTRSFARSSCAFSCLFSFYKNRKVVASLLSDSWDHSILKCFAYIRVRTVVMEMRYSTKCPPPLRLSAELQPSFDLEKRKGFIYIRADTSFQSFRGKSSVKENNSRK